MRVAMYYNNHDIRLEQMPVPKISSGELLVKVIASGICGSDVMEWYRIKKAPLVLGHEITGEIIERGEDVTRYKPHDRVFVSHHVPCNTCHSCLNGHHTVCETLHSTNYDPGGFSEYIRVPQINVDRGTFLLPDEVTFEQGVFIEPAACALRGQRIAKLTAGQSVLILGSGISGLIHLLLAKAMGAGLVFTTDISEYRLNAARRLGADAAINAKEYTPEKFRALNGMRLAELVIICTGNLSAFNQALKSVAAGGTVLFFAPLEPHVELSIPVNDFWRNGITLVPSYGNSPLDAAIAIELIRAGRVPVDELITHRLSLKEIAKGFRLTAEAGESIKIIINPSV